MMTLVGQNNDDYFELIDVRRLEMDCSAAAEQLRPPIGVRSCGFTEGYDRWTPSLT